MKSTPNSAPIRSAMPRAATAFVACYHSTANALLQPLPERRTVEKKRRPANSFPGRIAATVSSVAANLLCLVTVTMLAALGVVLGAAAAVYLLVSRSSPKKAAAAVANPIAKTPADEERPPAKSSPSDAPASPTEVFEVAEPAIQKA